MNHCSPPAVRRRLALVALAAFAAAGAVRAADADADADAVTLERARADAAAGRAILIDVREPQEHAGGVAPGARLLPSRQLGARLGEIPLDPKQPVYLICATQNRSSAALRTLRERGGYGHVRYVSGGMSEWARRGWPLVKPAP